MSLIKWWETPFTLQSVHKNSATIALGKCSVKVEWALCIWPSATTWAAQVAIKVLRDAWLSPARRERFAGEQRILAQLNHPSIARLYDANTLEDGTPWFVMEYVDGAPLTEYCRKNDCTIEERLKLLRLVCEAVQYAHQHALIHRDLKPSNILVKRDGNVRLLDFGIAKQMESLDTGVDQTRTALRFMTPAYAAPEQVRGERAAILTDVYSLGVVLYELLTGQLPFDLSNAAHRRKAERILTEQEAEKNLRLWPKEWALRQQCIKNAAAAEQNKPGPIWMCFALPRCTKIFDSGINRLRR